MSFNDDDKIVLPAGPQPIVPGRIQLEIRNNNTAPFESNSQKVLLKLTGEEKSRSGLDLVAVLDISGSMRDEDKLEKMKTAMLFVMKKLTLMDRLSIVVYSTTARRMCKLTQMTEVSQSELQNLIIGLRAHGFTNIEGGLRMGLDVLNSRSLKMGRVGVIMLMTDGQESTGSNAAGVQLGNVPVHTFGFGNGQDPQVLTAIATNSTMGGTYSDVPIENLNLAFSQCLGGLLSVVVQHLTVTVTQIKDGSTIKPPVSAGSFEQSKDIAAGSVTIRFGDLYIQEVRTVLVDLVITPTDREQGTDVLEVSYTYEFNGILFEANPSTVTVSRRPGLTAEELKAPPEVRAEEVRLRIADVIRQATDDADNNRLESAREKVSNGLNTLREADIEQLKAELSAELMELRKLMETKEIYEKEGRPFAYSLLISLATQRQAARGNDISQFQLFATPAMREILEEAKQLDNKDALERYVSEVIKALESIEQIIK